MEQLEFDSLDLSKTLTRIRSSSSTAPTLLSVIEVDIEKDGPVLLELLIRL